MAAVTRDDVLAVLKPAEDTVVAQIIATGASKEELTEANAWLQSDEALSQEVQDELIALWADESRDEEEIEDEYIDRLERLGL